MSSEISITSLALQEILEGIADSLAEAQRNLREVAPYDAYGRPNVVYHVPYLDFQLQVTSEFQTATETGGGTRSVLRFQPVKSATVTNSKTEIFSSISGKFVATIPNEGMPQIVLLLQNTIPVSDGTVYNAEITADVGNTAGEKLTGVTVEFNYDAAATAAMNATPPAAIPTFTEAEVSTNSEGLAVAAIQLPITEFEAGVIFVFRINLGTVEKTLAIGL